jgi:2-C-methyl-D-erythritol 4-phosphate cytidylyltransferase
MLSATPKQFLLLQNKPIALHSLEIFSQLEEAKEIIVVCDPAYHSLFEGFSITFAQPGPQRQDSVFNGLQMTSIEADWICIHDAARPFIDRERIKLLLQEGRETGAASLATPVKNTLKEIDQRGAVVKRTLDRASIWEIQTPQLLRKDILQAGFVYARAHDLSVTDDVSLAELVGHPVKLILGDYQNIKITTPEDLAFAKWLSIAP